MDIRVMGTREECSAFSSMIRNNVDKKYIRNISGWYANNRKGEFSTEGRIYINFRDTFTSMALEGPKELPEEDHKEEEESPRKGYCHYCGEKGNLMVLMWEGHGYIGSCAECSRKYMREQWIGNYLKEKYPAIYEELDGEVKQPTLKGILMDPTGSYEIWG